VGAGAAEGAIDASNMLKPAWLVGNSGVWAPPPSMNTEVREKDAALERRFQPIYVSQPRSRITIAILRGLKERYEVHHGVKILDSGDHCGRHAIASIHFRPLPSGQGGGSDRRGSVKTSNRDR